MIEILEIPKGPKTPYLFFDGNKGILNIEGRCIPEEPKTFFKELHEVLDRYEKDPKNILNITINLEYFNTASARELVTLFLRFKKFPAKITWCHEKKDQDMIESGQDFEEIMRTPFIYKIIER